MYTCPQISYTFQFIKKMNIQSEHLLAFSDKSIAAFMKHALTMAAETLSSSLLGWQYCKRRKESLRQQDSTSWAYSDLSHLELLGKLEGRTCDMGRTSVMYMQLTHI